VAYRADLAGYDLNLGQAYEAAGRPREAETAYDDGLTLLEALAQQHPAVRRFREERAKIQHNRGSLYHETGRPQEAEADYRKALAQFKALANEEGRSADSVVSLGTTQVALGGLALAGEQYEAARAWFSQAMAALQPLTSGPPVPEARQCLGQAHAGRAHALDHLGRHAEALADWDKALQQATEAQRPLRRLARAATLARLKRHAEAVAEAEAALPSQASGEERYTAAVVCSLSAAAVGHDATLSEADRRRRADGYAGKAVALLAQARNAGYFEAEGPLALLQRDPDLDPLRSRPDFQKLLREVSDPASPPAR
jgi:tetratricopeptide (TPR) repeat protein